MINYRESIVKFGQACYGCQECPLGRKLVDGRDPHVFGVGKVPADIVFVAEAPGAEEVVQRKPLVGRSGKFFNEKILGVAGLRREDVYITNTVLCRPSGNRTPLPAEIELCNHHLDAQITLIKPALIVTLGNVPLQGVCKTTGITKKRGRFMQSRKWSDGSTYVVFPIFHPSYCLRGSGLKEMREDAISIGEWAVRIKSGSLPVVGV